MRPIQGFSVPRNCAVASARVATEVLRALEIERKRRDHICVTKGEAPLSETEPIIFSPRKAGGFRGPLPHASQKPDTHKPDTQRLTSFDRHELSAILAVYGRKVAAGEWRDYAIDLGRETAVFSIFRRASECPLFRIEKTPRLARKQGAYSVVAPAGLILKRGHDLRRVLHVLEDRARLVAV
jgi:hypothetical protein